MAKLFIQKESETFNKASEDIREHIVYDYAKMFEGRPVFVTYYLLNKDSTREKTLENSVGIFGPDSPLKFSKIERFPLYSFEGIENVEEESTDFGLDTVNRGSAVIIPRLIDIPHELDHFTINQEGNEYVYRVDKVTIDSKKDEKFYKIEFHLIHNEQPEIDEQVTKEFITDYDFIGTGYKPVIEKNDSAILYSLNAIYQSIYEFITEYTYDQYTNTFLCDSVPVGGNPVITYDPVMHKFIENNDIFVPVDKKQVMDSIFILYIELKKTFKKLFVDDIYKSSIFYALETKDYTRFTKTTYGLFNNTNPVNELNHVKGRTILLANYNASGYIVFDSSFMTNLLNKTYFNTPERKLDDIILKYLNNTLNKNNVIDEISDLEIEIDMIALIKLVCVLFIILNFQKQLIKL